MEIICASSRHIEFWDTRHLINLCKTQLKCCSWICVFAVKKLITLKKLGKLDPFKRWNNMLQKVGDSVRVCQTLSLRERLGQNGDAEKQLFEKLWEWVRKPFQKPLPSQGEPWVELPNTQMVFYFLVQRTPISSKIWQRKVHPASRKSGTKQKSMGPKYSHTYGGHWKKSCRGLCWPSPPHCPPPPSWRPSSSLSAVSWEQTQSVDFSRCTNWEKSCNIWIRGE